MKKIDLFDKYTTPESWKDAVRSGVREKKEKKHYSISFLPSLQTVLAVVILCVIVGFVVSGGFVNLINTSEEKENTGYKPNAGFVGNNANNTTASENMTEEEMKYAYKAYSEAFGFEESEVGYESFVSELNTASLGDREILVTCGVDNARCKNANVILMNGSGRTLVGNTENDSCMVIIVPIVFDGKNSINTDEYNDVYKLYHNGGVAIRNGFIFEGDMQVEFKAYDELPGVMYAVCVIKPNDKTIASQTDEGLKGYLNYGENMVLEIVAGNFTDEEISQIYNMESDLTCSCYADKCQHLKLKNHDGLLFGLSFVLHDKDN